MLMCFFNERQCDSDCDKEDNDKDDADSGKSILCSLFIRNHKLVEDIYNNSRDKKRRWGKQYGWLEGRFVVDLLAKLMCQKWPLAGYLLQSPRHQRLWPRSRCLPSWPSSKTTRRRSHRSGDEEGDDEDDADGRKDDVGDVEADSHHSLLSPRCQGLLGLAKSIIIPDISTIIIKMTVTTIVIITTDRSQVCCRIL